MKKLLYITLALLTPFTMLAQDDTVEKGSYKILKFDALNMMGLGIQKLHLGYEVSPMKPNQRNLPTVQFNLIAPFNSLNECADVNFGIEGGVDLRFYQSRMARPKNAEGFFLGVGMDGGYVNFNRIEQYYNNSNFTNKEVDTEYDRIRTGIYFLTGAQSKLGEKLYFDVSVGIGWSNVSVTTDDETFNDPNWYQYGTYCGVFYILYEEGKYQQFYMPVSFSIGYNFGNK